MLPVKQFEKFVRAYIEASKSVLGLCLGLLVSCTLASSPRFRTYNGLAQVPAKTQIVNPAKDQLWTDRYVNYEYGYSLTIPRRLVGLSPPAPWPQHGIAIWISRKDHAHILTNADFSAADYPSLDAAFDSDLQELRKNAEELQVVDRHRERLGPLQAIVAIVRYKEAVSGTSFVDETITAIRKAKSPEEDVLYTVTLVTPESRYQGDRKYLKNILRSWRLRPLPR